MTPASSPPSSTSKKNETFMSVRHPEVRVDYRLVPADLFRGAVADLPAVIEDYDAIRDVHDHAHVVLDQHDRRSVVVVDVEDEAAHVLLFLEVHSGHRLVEQQ